MPMMTKKDTMLIVEQLNIKITLNPKRIGSSVTLQRTVKIDMLKSYGRGRYATRPAFWPTALLRRTSVLSQAKPWRRGQFTCAEPVKCRSVEPPPDSETSKKKDTTYVVSFFFGGDGGIRTHGTSEGTTDFEFYRRLLITCFLLSVSVSLVRPQTRMKSRFF